MIAIGRKVKQRLVVVIWNVFTQNGKETIPISTFVALSIFNEPNIAEDIYLIYLHDDVFELYLNGEKLVSTGLVWKNNVYLKLSEEAKKKLRKGKNVIAAHCHNTTGGSYVSFRMFREKENAD